MLYWTAFPSQLGDIKDALPLVLDVWKGNHVDEEQAVLAAFNVVGYAYKNVRGVPVFGSTDADVEAAFAQCMTMGSAEALPWGIILPIAWDVLRKLLKM